jgi:serine/threonine protein phosphatase PrpC
MDGHGGDKVAEFCSRNLEKVFKDTRGKIADRLGKVIRNLAEATSRHYEVGSTISIVSVTNHWVHVAFLGDSPVIIRTAGGKIDISPEHNVRNNNAERLAAEKRGGVYINGYICEPDSGDGLQMSRALGDCGMGSIVSKEPEIYKRPIDQNSWVLVASDGLIDPSHEGTENVEQIADMLNNGKDAGDLIEWASRKDLHDNATAIVWRP